MKDRGYTEIRASGDEEGSESFSGTGWLLPRVYAKLCNRGCAALRSDEETSVYESEVESGRNGSVPDAERVSVLSASAPKPRLHKAVRPAHGRL